ncbi:mechanosensitive ion channel family protein [Marinobacterium marinum]|uniref:Small-conductance mechanosensitive channel n=1 Tax=Marinobacterium marinum TaxID=2756129 RepID=A0A7W2ABP9_9GAMM|nr:mechanosensitive ion channel family protein [Marinobacterium marinum]MBA4501702.1 mechanosensitive ion channel family protein [Marinobacterium marinum]
MEDTVKQELIQFQEVYTMVVEFFVNYSFQILGALIILLLGLWVAAKVSKWSLALMQRHNLDITLSRFIASCVRILVIAMVAIVALGKVGISVTPLIAMIGAVGLGAGLAIQGLLSNYSAGLTIVLTRPYVVGDTIQVQGVSGQVKEVHLSHTLLTNEDGVDISIPNKHVVGEIIHNSHAYTLAEVSIDIAYSASPEQACERLKSALVAFGDEVCQEPAAQVGIEGFGENGITLGVRIWLPTERYYDLLYRINMALFNELKDAGIEIPFPQREVRLLNTPPAA